MVQVLQKGGKKKELQGNTGFGVKKKGKKKGRHTIYRGFAGGKTNRGKTSREKEIKGSGWDGRPMGGSPSQGTEDDEGRAKEHEQVVVRLLGRTSHTVLNLKKVSTCKGKGGGGARQLTKAIVQQGATE